MKKSFFKKSNSGRSIFELLAVMAIIALLSVTVVKSYEKAVSKARADGQQRQIAMIVKEFQQKIMGSFVPNIEKIKMNDTEFTVGQGKTGSTKDYFGIKVKTTDESICEELISASFLSPALITVNGEKEGTCPGEVTFYFPKDPSNTALLEMGDESIFSEDNSSGGSSGSGGNAQNPSVYNNDEEGCSGNNFVYCSNGTCVSNANECPAPACPSVLDCGEHGSWDSTECKCTCDTGWYGEICDSDCDGMKVATQCLPCDVPNAMLSLLRYSSATECHKCDNRFWGVYSVSDGPSCLSCDEEFYQVTSSIEECERCDNRKYCEGTGYCVLKTNECPCSTSGSCTDNSSVCPGYYCDIANGNIVDVGEQGDYCGDDYYVPGSGTVQALGTPQTVKTGYLLSPDELSWDGGKNYCDALKTTISAGVTVNGINYANYSNLLYGLAPVPSGCSYSTPNKPENICSELQSFSSYGQLWLNQLCQFDCETSGVDACLATNSSSALSAYTAYRGYVFGDDRSVAHQAMCH